MIRLYGIAILAVFCAQPVAAQHHHSDKNWHLGARGVGLISHVTPAMAGRDLTEAYLTQPSISLMGSQLAGRVSFMGMLNLEGLTLKRGQLNHGGWGEGYVDRRHPHTYLHEAVVTSGSGSETGAFSVSLGRGFAPFGTDDPMVRGFVLYPSNHHLAQILERWVAIGAGRLGPVGLEVGVFNGDEPTKPTDFGKIDRFGDSWSARGTFTPVEGIETQLSYAHVESPELAAGGGLNQRKKSYSARFERDVRGMPVYALIEHERTADTHSSDVEVWVFRSNLAEARIDAGFASIGARYEFAERPEEERLEFRSGRPATDNSILGITEWKTVTLSVSREMRVASARFAPFVEIAHAIAKNPDPFALAQPKLLYGDDRIWNFSIGVNAGVGMQHSRMGRYGAALPN